MCNAPLSPDEAALALIGLVLVAVICLVVLWNLGGRFSKDDENDE